MFKFIYSFGFVFDWLYKFLYYYNSFDRHLSYNIFKSKFVKKEDLFDGLKNDMFSSSFTLVTNTTNICNAKCSFCAYPKAMNEKSLETGTMSMEIFKKSVDEYSSAGGKSIDFTPVVGDPLVDKFLFERIEYVVKNTDIKDIHLTTNGILLNKNDNYRKLIESGVTNIYISTQGTDSEQYKLVYGVDNYEQVLHGLTNLLFFNKFKNYPAKIIIRFRNSQKPSEILKSSDFKKYIKPHLCKNILVNFTVDFDNWGGAVKQKDMHGNMKLRKLPKKNINFPCQSLFTLSIRHDGRVRACGCRFIKNDTDDLIIGNIKNNTIKQLSNNQELKDKINGFYNNKRPETCVNCTFYLPITKKWYKIRKQ